MHELPHPEGNGTILHIVIKVTEKVQHAICHKRPEHLSVCVCVVGVKYYEAASSPSSGDEVEEKSISCFKRLSQACVSVWLCHSLVLG